MAEVTTRLYDTSDAAAFRELNLAWISQHFEVEAKDLDMLNDPDGVILSKGGKIIVGALDGKTVGVVALIPIDERTMELAKMAVDETQRGAGIGMAVLSRAIEEARATGMQKIWLETNTVLAAALRLYLRAGFRELEPSEQSPSPYARCNAQLIMDLR